MTRIRTFIAIDVDKPVHNRLIELQETLADSGTDVKWVEESNLHLTLLFLGEVEDKQLHQVCRTVADVSAQHAPFALSLEKVGCFPNLRRPRILWAGVGEGLQELVKLHDDLEEPLLDMGCYRREERDYTPHLTLGRIKGDNVTAKLNELILKNQEWSGGQSTIREVLVMSSKLRGDGPEYTVMARAKLGNQA
jgi:RNA 2',3'-cyclic 3'-phosphodiesterase